ncbi:MAG: DIP1984 family protein [Firmicutes bacterium]|nr:DIP1984 family protein [Bacillota bacterium]
MKLAEALILRADMKKQMERFVTRICGNCRIQEGDVPNEEPNELIKEYEKLVEKFEKLVADINNTNAVTKNAKGVSIMELIAKRDCLALKRNAYSSIASQLRGYNVRASKSEIKFVNIVDAKTIEKKFAAVAAKYREVDSEIQALNWSTDLIEA